MAKQEPQTKPARTKSLGPRVYLVVLAIVAVVIGARLVTRWLKWLLIAVAIAAVVSLVLGAGRDRPDRQ